MKVNLSCRIPEEVRGELQEIARLQDRSLSNLVILILKDYLERRGK